MALPPGTLKSLRLVLGTLLRRAIHRLLVIAAKPAAVLALAGRRRGLPQLLGKPKGNLGKSPRTAAYPAQPGRAEVVPTQPDVPGGPLFTRAPACGTGT